MQGAELVDLVVRAGGLATELVAGDVEDLEALVVQVLVHLLKRLVVRGETAAGGGIDHDDDLALEVGHLDLVACGIEDAQIVKTHFALLLINFT